MKDREQNEYEPHYIWRPKKGRLRIGVLSRARQSKKASGRTGRQWVKYRKAQRHIAKYEMSVGVRSAPDAQEPPK
jgi:hypothetical protein